MAKGTFDMNDHDLLIALNTKMDSVASCLDGLPKMFEAMDARMRAMETKMATCEAGNADNTKEIDALRGKSNLLDAVIGLGTVIGTIIGVIFGNRQV
jgi:hypothetical protein